MAEGELHNKMVNAGKQEFTRTVDLEEQLLTIVKVLHMMPELRQRIFKLVQNEIQHYLHKPNDFIRAYTGELLLKDAKHDYSKQYKDKDTRGRGW